MAKGNAKSGKAMTGKSKVIKSGTLTPVKAGNLRGPGKQTVTASKKR